VTPIGRQEVGVAPTGTTRTGETRTGLGPLDTEGRVRSAAATYGRALLVALPAWILSRILVAVSLVAAHLLVSRVRPGNAGAAFRVHQGLLAWDGGWYQSIAAHGYVASSVQSLRFFPAFPMAARVLGHIPGLGVGAALVIIANLCALAAMAALVVLVDHDMGDGRLARRSVWLLALAPSAYSLVLGYADAALLLCSVVTLLAARSGRWWWAAAAGLVAGLVRPVGILLVVPVAIEIWSAWRARASGAVNGRVAPVRKEKAARAAPSQTSTPANSTSTTPATTGTVRTTTAAGQVAAVLGPVAGTAVYLGWVRAQFGDLWLPFRVQQQKGHRGVVTLPLASMWHNVESVVHGHHLGSALHVPWVLVCLVLLVVAFRRLPFSYACFAAAVLVVSLASSNLDSFERYALGAFPLVIAASTLTSRRGVELAVLAVAGAGMVAYAVLAFMGVVVP
jgi:hypothetical protein